MQHRNVIVKGIFAGILIGLAGMIYLSAPAKIIGAIFFSFAIIVILFQGLYLFTSKVGYVLPFSKDYMKVIFKTILGNIVGLAIVAGLIHLTDHAAIQNAKALVEAKLSYPWYASLSLSILCGAVMYIICDLFHDFKTDFVKVVVCMFGIVIFLMSGFEHSIANIFYFFLAKSFSLKTLLYLIIMMIGNGIGAVGLNYLNQVIKKGKE